MQVNYSHNLQFLGQPRALAVVETTTTPVQVDLNEASLVSRDEVQNGGFLEAKSIMESSEVVLVLNFLFTVFR